MMKKTPRGKSPRRASALSVWAAEWREEIAVWLMRIAVLLIVMLIAALLWAEWSGSSGSVDTQPCPEIHRGRR